MSAPVVVYWRRGCFFCDGLLRALRAAGVQFAMRDIWADEEARRFVAKHNDGCETVPTVVVDDWVVTNPDPHDLLQRIAATHPELVGAPGPDDPPSI